MTTAGAYTIGTAARLTGVPPWKLRAWEAAGLMRPDRSRSGYRLYKSFEIDEILRLRAAVDRAGRLGAHALSSSPAADVRPLPVLEPTSGLIEVLETASGVGEATWAGLLWRTETGELEILAEAPTGARGGRVLRAGDEAAWTRLLVGRRDVDAVVPGDPPDLADLRGRDLFVIPVGSGSRRGALLLHRAERPPDQAVRRLLAALLLARLDAAAIEASAARVARLETAGRQLDEVVAEQDELQPLLDAAVGVLVELTGCDTAEVALADRTGRRLLVPVARGMSPRFVAGCRHFRSDEGLAGRAFQSRRPVVSNDLRTDPRVTRQVVRDEGVRSYVSLPLVHRGRAIGVLQLGSRSAPIDSNCEQLMTLANRLAAAIDAVGLARQLDDERHRQATAVRAWAARLSSPAATEPYTAPREATPAAAMLTAIARGTVEATHPELTLEVDTSDWRGAVSETAAVELANAVRVLVELARQDASTHLELIVLRKGSLSLVSRHRRQDQSTRLVPVDLGSHWSVTRHAGLGPIVEVAADLELPREANGTLTPREVQILQLFGESHSTAEVAALLGVSTKTICNRLTLTYAKLGVAGRTQAVTEAIRRGLVHVA